MSTTPILPASPVTADLCALFPLAQCSQCGDFAPCDDAAYGEPVCELCLHGTNWHRGCDVGDAPTVCPFCSAVLATHDHH